MAVYDSLQRRERITTDDISSTCKEFYDSGCGMFTLLDERYPENWKSIYKPSFLAMYMGLGEILSSKTLLTIYADPIQNKEQLDNLSNLVSGFVWEGLSVSEMKAVINAIPSKNAFYLPELENKSNDLLNQFMGSEVKENNVFYSEIWKKSLNCDYSNQAQERLYLGISKKVLILKPLSQKQIDAIAQYCKVEDIRVYIARDVYNDEFKKAFVRTNVKVVDLVNPQDYTTIVLGAN